MASSSSSGSGSDWEGDGEEEIAPCQCLFCSVIFDGGAQIALEHCVQHHSFDLHKYARKMSEQIIIANL